jgi:hypothetical protein
VSHPRGAVVHAALARGHRAAIARRSAAASRSAARRSAASTSRAAELATARRSAAANCVAEPAQRSVDELPRRAGPRPAQRSAATSRVAAHASARRTAPTSRVAELAIARPGLRGRGALATSRAPSRAIGRRPHVATTYRANGGRCHGPCASVADGRTPTTEPTTCSMPSFSSSISSARWSRCACSCKRGPPRSPISSGARPPRSASTSPRACAAPAATRSTPTASPPPRPRRPSSPSRSPSPGAGSTSRPSPPSASSPTASAP